MSYVCAAEVTSRIKGHHVYNYQYEIGEDWYALGKEENVIVVQKTLGDNECNKNKKKFEEFIVGHIPELFVLTQ